MQSIKSVKSHFLAVDRLIYLLATQNLKISSITSNNLLGVATSDNAYLLLQ